MRGSFCTLESPELEIKNRIVMCPMGGTSLFGWFELTGCEIAYELYLRGKKPTIVEMMDDLIVTKGVCLANTSFLRDFFEANRVPGYLETGVKAIKDGAVTVAGKDGMTITVRKDGTACVD